MPSIRELFKSEVKGLTGGLYKKSKIYIESQGAINPPRLKALALSSPNSIADLAGITVAAALGVPISSANRPSDTIFGNITPFAKPLIGLAGPLAQRNTGIINPKKAYYIKPAPAPYQVVNQIKNGISTNPIGTLLTAAKNELRDGTLREIFAKRKNISDKYGSQYQHIGTRSKPLATDKKFSENAPNYSVSTNLNTKRKEYNQSSVSGVARVKSAMTAGNSKWDQINNDLLSGQYKEISNLEIANKNVNIPYVAFQLYGKGGEDAHILLPGTVTGLSEDIEPNWNTYKYVGSPFNTYRYSGVERSIKFDLKLYATDAAHLTNLKKNLNKLRETAFPDKYITEIKSGGKTITNGFNPNLVTLTISGYYAKLFGFVDGLNISVDDEVPWPTDSDFDGVTSPTHPSIISVSISMKIIEVIQLKSEANAKTLKYNFTGVPEGALPLPKAPLSAFGQALEAAAAEQSRQLQKIGKLLRLVK
jgi:hypothetical protein